MKRIKIMGLCLVAAFAMSAVASATASAALPELGRCVAVSPPTAVGVYSSSKCTTTGGTDPDWNWLPGPGAKPGFKGSGTTATLEAVNKSKIKCTSTTDEGKWIGPKNAELTSIVFKGCESITLKASCQSGANVGEIVNNPLEQQIGFINKSLTLPSVGVDLTPTTADAGNLAKFECGGAEIFVTGSVIAPITAVDAMSLASTTKFTGKVGKQIPEKLEGEPKDTLITHIPLLGTVEQSAEIVTAKNTNEEKLEIKAL